MTVPLDVAVVGLGLAGSTMLEAIKQHQGMRLAAAVDPDPELRRAFSAALVLPVFETLAELLQTVTIDIVYLASPHEFHAEQATSAAQAGCHVIVEKPMALDVAGCDAMVEAAEHAGVALVIGHTHGFDPAITRLAALIKSGQYGRVGHLALLNYTNFVYRPRRPADLDPSRGAGVVLNQVAHQVEIARTVLDREVVAVRALTTRLDDDRPIDGSCTALLEFEGGIPASLIYSGYDHFDSDEYTGWATEGGRVGAPRHGAARARLAGLTVSEAVERSSSLGFGRGPGHQAPATQPHFGEVLVSCARADLRVTSDGLIAYTDQGLVREPIENTHGWPGHEAVLDEMVDAARTGRRPRHDGHFGRETVRICLAMLSSAARGQTEHLQTTGVSGP